jgi:hypothetical protein
MRILHSRSLLSSLVLVALGCPGDDTSMDEGADSGASGSSTTSTTPTSTTEPVTTSTTEPVTTSDTTAGDTMVTTATTDVSDSTTTGTSADTGTTGPIGGACGDGECNGTEWCDFTDDVCGVDGVGGMATCELRPEGCPEIYQPVCGCDGQVHGNDCDANAAGVDVDAEGDCETPAGYFRCGYRYCDPQFEFCQVQYSDIGGVGHSYACVGPMACAGPPSCDCLDGELCFEFGCEETPDGGVMIGCPGG